MQTATENKQSMYVPNWLIALELGAGAVLLYISSATLMNTDMRLSRSISAPTAIEQLENAPSGSDSKIVLSENSSASLFTK